MQEAVAPSSPPLFPQSSDLTRSTITLIHSQNSAIPALLEGNDPVVPSKGVMVLTESRRNEAYSCRFSREGFSRHPNSTLSEEPSHTIFWWLPQFPEARSSPPLSLRADSPKSVSHLLHWQCTPFGCQESGALAEGGQAERKRYITAAALRHDVRVWKPKKA